MNFFIICKNQILSQQFKKKGADLFCGQPSYLECLKIKRDQCLRELKPFNKVGMCMQNNPIDEDQIQKTLTPTNQEVIVTILKDEYDLETLRNNTVK
jgi:hypothetical protein